VRRIGRRRFLHGQPHDQRHLRIRIGTHDTAAFWLRRDSARRQCHTTKWWKDVIFRALVGTA
jgi:hypothetical protein